MAGLLGTILVPVDGSEGSTHAARRAAGLAKETGSNLTLMYVYDKAQLSLLGLLERTVDDVVEIEKQARRAALDQATTAIAGVGVETGRVVRKGDPAEEIVRYATEEDIGLIVIGARGLGRMKALLLGSVSNKVVHHAPCPVLVHRER